jgi:hypothetical protein
VELGFEGDDLEMRAMLFVCYQTWETPMFRDITENRRRELIQKRVDLLTFQVQQKVYCVENSVIKE